MVLYCDGRECGVLRMNGEGRRSREAVRNSIRSYGVKVMDPASLPLKKMPKTNSQDSVSRFSEKSLHSQYDIKEGNVGSAAMKGGTPVDVILVLVKASTPRKIVSFLSLKYSFFPNSFVQGCTSSHTLWYSLWDLHLRSRSVTGRH